MLRRWVQQLQSERTGTTPIGKALTPEQQKIQELEARINRLEREKDIIKNRLPGTPWPMELETRPLHWSQRTVVVCFLEAESPSKNLTQGKLRTREWWHLGDPV